MKRIFTEEDFLENDNDEIALFCFKACKLLNLISVTINNSGIGQDYDEFMTLFNRYKHQKLMLQDTLNSMIQMRFDLTKEKKPKMIVKPLFTRIRYYSKDQIIKQKM